MNQLAAQAKNLRAIADLIEKEGRSIEMDSRKQKVIEKFCALSATVGGYFNNHYSSDGFCAECKYSEGWNWTFEDKITEFIEAAVKEKIERDGTPPSRWSGDEPAVITATTDLF